jgi:bla regulator protein blaR1
MIKAALYLAAFYLVYSMFLSSDTLYRRNRAFILIVLLLSFILPLITIQTNKPVNFLFFGKSLTEVLVNGSGRGTLSATSGYNALDGKNLVLIIYVAGLLIFAGKLFIDLSELMILIIRNKSERSNIIRFRGLNTAGFSAMGQVFINSSLSDTEADEIKRHEQNHLDYYHFIDIIFVEVVKAIQWFNPFIHLFDRSLRAVHEYQADEGCLRKGITVINYQQLIMSQLFKSKAFIATNSFSNPSLIKKRMIMMTKERSRMLANLKLLMVLPVIAVVMIAFSSCKGKTTGTENTSEEIAPPPPPPPPPSEVNNVDTPYVRVDVMPQFPGGDQAILQFIAENTKYPENAKTKGIQGRVVVRFAVETDGSIDKISVLKGVDPELDAEALRVTSSLPVFEKPAIANGKPVSVWYMLPITFTLK